MNPLLSHNDCFSALFADQEILDAFSTERTLKHFADFESALTSALGAAGLADAETVKAARIHIATFEPVLSDIRDALNVDGLPVPEYVRQLKAHVGKDLSAAVHVGATSQDLLDTALALTLRRTNRIFLARILRLEETLGHLIETHGAAPMMGRTRMQAALPIAVGDRLATWLSPLSLHRTRLEELRPRVELLQLGGAVGDRAKLGDKGDQVAELLAEDLGLGNPTRAWHAMRDGMAEYAGWLSLVTGALGKMGQDLCLMAQQGVDEVSFEGGGSSSAMPHKQNPVLAETLVSLARFNAVQVSGMHHAMVHEQERSGSAWTLEWMILPAMIMTTGRALLIAEICLKSIKRMGQRPGDNIAPSD